MLLAWVSFAGGAPWARPTRPRLRAPVPPARVPGGTLCSPERRPPRSPAGWAVPASRAMPWSASFSRHASRCPGASWGALLGPRADFVPAIADRIFEALPGARMPCLPVATRLGFQRGPVPAPVALVRAQLVAVAVGGLILCISNTFVAKRRAIVLPEVVGIGCEVLGGDAPRLRRGLRLPLDVHVGVPLGPVDRLRVLGHLLMRDHFFDHARLLGDDRLFGFLRHLNDFFPRSGKVGVRGWAIHRPAFNRDLLLAQAHRFLHRPFCDPAVDAHVPALDLPFADGEVFFYHRNRHLLVALDAPCGCALVRHTCVRARLLLSAARCGRRTRHGRGRGGTGGRAGPALLPPLRGPLVEINRVQALQNRHATLR